MTIKSGVLDALQRVDGWMNLLTGLGGKRSATKNTKIDVSEQTALSQAEVDVLFCDDGIGRRAARLFPQHATRKWCQFSGDEDSKLDKLLRRKLKAPSVFRKALTKARSSGGSIVVMYVNDGNTDMKVPLNYKTCVSIEGTEVFERDYIQVQKFYESGMKAGTPEIFTCWRWNGGSKDIHESRCLFFDGEEVTESRRMQNNGFGDSLYRSTGSSLRGLGTAYATAEGILNQFVTPVMKVNGLANAIATGQEEEIKKRVEIMALSRSMINALIIDSEEEWTTHTAAITGLADMLDRFGNYAAAVNGVPAKILLGTQSAGLGAKDDADTRNFHEQVNAYQVEEMEDELLKLIGVCCACKAYGLKDADDYEINWLPLSLPSDKEGSEARKAQAETDQIYASMNVLTPEEIRENRFKGGYSFTTSVSDDVDAARLLDKDMQEEPEEPEDSAGGEE